VSTDQQLPASSAPLSVAIDIGPLLGPHTGVGAAVQQLTLALAADDRVSLMPYACSFRGHLDPGAARLPLPAFVAQRLWARSGWPKVDRWLGRAQVVHGTNYTVPPSRLPEVVTVYDCWFLRNPEQASGDVVRAGRVLRRAVARGATVHASSNATADAVRELLHTERVEVIALAPLPVPDAGDSSAPIAELIGTPYVLALGTLERRKNLPRLVAAFGQIAAADPDVRLVLAGSDGDDRAAINAAIDGLHPKARERVLFTGRINEGAKRWLLRHAQVLAYPSLDEGFGFPLLEAMGYNVPVVASTAGSIPEVAGEAAVLVAPHDVSALAEALQRTLTDSSLRTQLIDAGQLRLKDYSWAQTATRLIELYSRVVSTVSA
jgi:glycosyltransferase involved in cell wall biosynthesis